LKRWAIVTIAAYAALLMLLALPLIVLASIDWSDRKIPPRITISPEQALNIFREFGFWIWMIVVLMAQAALLLVPVCAAEGRPVRRRHIGWLITAASFLLANLLC
jgi:hypothetical protein